MTESIGPKETVVYRQLGVGEWLSVEVAAPVEPEPLGAIVRQVQGRLRTRVVFIYIIILWRLTGRPRRQNRLEARGQLQQVFEHQHHLVNAILALHLEVDLGAWLLLQLLTQGRDCKGGRIGLIHFQNSFANL